LFSNGGAAKAGSVGKLNGTAEAVPYKDFRSLAGSRLFYFRRLTMPKHVIDRQLGLAAETDRL